jgi:hypothetical protein
MKKIWMILPTLMVLVPISWCQSLSERYAEMLTLPKGYVCYRAADSIRIDGLSDDLSWDMAQSTDAFVDISGEGFPRPRYHTTAKMLWDEHYLYILAELKEPHVWANLTERDCVVYADNDFEVFIDPEGEGRDYFEIEVNAIGTVFDLSLTGPYRAPKYFVQVQWNCPGLKIATHINGTLNDPSDTDKGWTVEMAIPYQALANNFGSCLKAGNWLRLNYSRVEWHHEVDSDGHYDRKKNPQTGRYFPEDNWVWTPTGRVAMHMPERWGYLYLSDHVVGGVSEIFRYPDYQPVHRFLWMLFYAQEERFGLHHTYYKTLADFKLTVEDKQLIPPGYKITVETTGYTYEIAAVAPDGVQYVINESGRCFERR